MKLRALRLSDFKGFAAPGVVIENFTDGLNVLTAANEFGKTTLLDALRAALFTKHSVTGERSLANILPYTSTDGPHVEVDVETSAGRFRIEKRFAVRKMASVVDLDTRQTVASGSEVNDWLAETLGGAKPEDGPTGLLWVEQGRSLARPVPSQATGSVIAGLLAREVSEVTGGERLHRVLALAEAQLAELVTPGRRQPTGDHKKALDTQNALERRLQDLEGRLKTAERNRQELSELQDQLAAREKPETVQHLKSQQQRATESWQTAQKLGERLQALNQEASVAAEKLKLLETELSELDKGTATLQRVQQQAGNVAKEIAALDKKLLAATQQAEDGRANFAAAMKAVEHARSVYAGVRAQAKAQDSRDRLERARAVQAAAEQLQSRLRQAQEICNRTVVDREAVAKLEDLKSEIDTATARVEAGQVRLSVSYLADSKAKVRIGGSVLRDNEEHAVDGRAELELDGIGRLLIDAGAGRGDGEERQLLEKLQRDFSDALAGLGVESLGEARRVLEQKTIAAREAQAAQDELARLLPGGMQALTDTVARLAASAAEVPEPESNQLSEDEAETRLREAEQTREARREVQTAHDSARHQATEALARKKYELETNEQKLAELRERFGDEATWAERRRALQEDKSRAEATREEKRSARETLAQKAGDVAQLAAEKDRCDALVTQHMKEIAELKHRTGQLVGALQAGEANAAEEERAEAHSTLIRVKRQVASFEAEQRALETLIAAAKDVEANTQRQFFAPVMAEVQPLLDQLMPESELTLTSEFAPQHLRRKGLDEPFGALSGGTQEQVAILTRLAFARLMARKGHHLPVILDDALVYSDDDRIAKMLSIIEDAASATQVVVLSCRQKTFDGLDGTRLKVTTWQT